MILSCAHTSWLINFAISSNNFFFQIFNDDDDEPFVRNESHCGSAESSFCTGHMNTDARRLIDLNISASELRISSRHRKLNPSEEGHLTQIRDLKNEGYALIGRDQW